MFVLLVSAELYGQKHNIEVGFPAIPTMTELIGHVEATFQIENRLMRPSGRPKQTFRLEYIQVFDEVLQRWVDLLSSTQLHEWAQLYVFQPDTPSRVDMQMQIPATRPMRSMPSGNESEKLWQLFQDIDVNGNGYIERDELQRFFSVLGLFEFSEPQVDEYFVHADSNRDGVLSYAEFAKFSGTHPHVVESLEKAGEYYFQAVKVKDAEKAYLRLKYDEVEARYRYLQHRRDVLLLEARIQAQRDALIRAEEERIYLERNRELERMRGEFLQLYGQDPDAGSPRRRVTDGVFYTEGGYGASRKYPRPVSSPPSKPSSPQRKPASPVRSG
eukprot:TRINITY_DN16561_c0_g1_i1.p2 TRINITY_DN16561_c0_g1~~TRINITY_DN16561_c0_g1_i1.p2  ORF type:complete len:329 (+),score=138.21 TRINITY_DN16561_c0_g1_i1:86-1072(+)